MCLLAAINAKYIHTNLAVRYLRELCGLAMREYSINDRVEAVTADLYRSGHKLMLFSCYIWNIRMVLDICARLKKADPSIVIALGGPEVSFDAPELLERNAQVDFVLCGEGESSLPAFLQAVQSGDFSSVPGVVYRMGNGIRQNAPAPELDMSLLPFPYRPGELAELAGRLVYYETSRGCPFRCAFCLSSAGSGVRFLPLARVKRELLQFIQAGVPLVKLVDRTFNADNRRAVAIVNFIKEHSRSTCFHFEVKAETMSEELIDALCSAKPGLFQLEIGVQSTDPSTLAKIKRGADFGKITNVVRRLKQSGGIHLHLDLIAGLPGETMEQFKHSFNDVMKLRPHDLQLGFLKKLKGAGICCEGSAFTDEPPYEVIHSDAMSYEELLILKDIEDVLEKYYNSGAFERTMEHLLQVHAPDAPFDLFAGVAEFFREKGYLGKAISRKDLYEILHSYCEEVLKDSGAEEMLIFDYCMRYRDHLSFMHDGGLKERAFEFLKNGALVEKYFPERAGEKPVQLYKHLRFYRFSNAVCAFDCEKQIVCDITADFT